MQRGQEPLRIRPTSWRHRWKWLYLLAEQTAQRSLASLPFQNHGSLIVLARVAEARHDFQQAIRLARRADNTEALSIIITSNLAMGKIDEAARAVGTLIQGGAGLTSYTLRSLVELAQGKDEAALADLQRAIASEEPDEVASSVWARTLLGRLDYRRVRMRRQGSSGIAVNWRGFCWNGAVRRTSGRPSH